MLLTMKWNLKQGTMLGSIQSGARENTSLINFRTKFPTVKFEEQPPVCLEYCVKLQNTFTDTFDMLKNV